MLWKERYVWMGMVTGGPGIQHSLSGWKGPQQVERRGTVLGEETTAGMVQWYK